MAVPSTIFKVFILMPGILVSLGSGLVFLVRESGKTQRTVIVLSIRAALSMLLLVLLAVGFAGKFLILASKTRPRM